MQRRELRLSRICPVEFWKHVGTTKLYISSLAGLLENLQIGQYFISMAKHELCTGKRPNRPYTCGSKKPVSPM